MAKPLASKLVLIIEDEAVFQSVLKQFLLTLGADVVEADQGQHALDKLASIRPDLIICDLEMPEMNGLTFVERFRATDTTTPILIVSGTDQMTDIARVLRLGVQDVLLKPVEDFPVCAKRCWAVFIPICSPPKSTKKSNCFRIGTR
ncbi:Regulator of RpoS [Sodalis praecaptivus]